MDDKPNDKESTEEPASYSTAEYRRSRETSHLAVGCGKEKAKRNCDYRCPVVIGQQVYRMIDFARSGS